MAANTLRFFIDNGVLKIRISKETDVSKDQLYLLTRKYLKNKDFRSAKSLEYKGYKVKIRSSFKDGQQFFTIVTDNSDLLNELELRLLLIKYSDTCNFQVIRIPVCSKYSADGIILGDTVLNIMKQFNSKYFITSENYVDVVLAVKIGKIINELINIIDTISEEDEGKWIINDITD